MIQVDGDTALSSIFNLTSFIVFISRTDRNIIHDNIPFIGGDRAVCNRRIAEYRDICVADSVRIPVSIGNRQADIIAVCRSADICRGTGIGEYACLLVIGQRILFIGISRPRKQDLPLTIIAGEVQVAIFITRHHYSKFCLADLYRERGGSIIIPHISAEREIVQFYAVRLGTDSEHDLRRIVIVIFFPFWNREIDLVRQHRTVVMHRHHQRAGSHIAGGIRHRNIDAVRKSVICADGTSTPHIIVSLLPGQLICVFNLPRTAGLSLRGALYLYLDAVHRQCFVGGKPILVERLAVDQAQGNGWCVLL